MSLSREERLRLADIDPELEELLTKINLPQLPDASPLQIVQGLRSYMKQQHKPMNSEEGIVEQDIQHNARDGFELRARMYEPETQSSSKRPLVVYFHGGGWTIGSPEDAQAACRLLARELDVVCIAPSYRQGPEDPFPAGINDTWDWLQWIAGNIESKIGVSLEKGFIVGGSSAGGNMAAVLGHLARDNKLVPAITGQFLLAPMIIPPEACGSLDEAHKANYISRTQEECQRDPVLSPALAQIFHDSAQGDPQSPMFVPYIWPNGHKDLPRTYFQVCGMDTLRDECLIYEQMLREDCAVETRLDVYPGMPHIFWNTFPQLKQGKKSAVDLVAALKWLLRC